MLPQSHNARQSQVRFRARHLGPTRSSMPSHRTNLPKRSILRRKGSSVVYRSQQIAVLPSDGRGNSGHQISSHLTTYSHSHVPSFYSGTSQRSSHGNLKTVISVSPRSLWRYESPIPKTKHRPSKRRHSSHRQGDSTRAAGWNVGTPYPHVSKDHIKSSSGSRVNLGRNSMYFDHSYSKALAPQYLDPYDSLINAYPSNVSTSNFSPAFFVGRRLETRTVLEISSWTPLRIHTELTSYRPLQWSVYLPPSTARSQCPSYGDSGFYDNEELLESPACAGAERLAIQMGCPSEPGDGTMAWMRIWGAIYVDHPRHTAYPRAEITVYDVLQAIHTFLHVRLTTQEMERLTMEARNHIAAARSRRIFVEGSDRADGRSWTERDEWAKTPMRVDVLTVGGAGEFAGLSLRPGSNPLVNNHGVAELLLRLGR